MSSKIESFIQNTSYKNRKNNKEFKIFFDVPVFVKDPLPEHVDILNVLSQVEEKIPPYLTSKIEVVYVGQFREFEEKDINAMYRDGAIYVTNEQDDDEDMIDDILHEVAHAVEDAYAEFIYSDGKIQNEYIGKRTRLKNMLEEYGYLEGFKHLDFTTLEYDSELDNYLYKELGREKLETFTNGLFVTPYATIGVREYFATAFEECLLKKPSYVKRISPMAYAKIERLLTREV